MVFAYKLFELRIRTSKYIIVLFLTGTLDGKANGGAVKDSYFWPSVLSAGQANFWRKGAMGGETRFDLQGQVFEPGYPSRTYEKQDFAECTEVTHATYM